MTEKSGEIFRIAREQAGLSQEKATEVVHVVTRTISRYEKGKEPPGRVVVAMDKGYGCNGELIKKWLREIGFTGTIKFSLSGKKSVWNLIKSVLNKAR